MNRNPLRIALVLLAFALPARAALDFDGTDDKASVNTGVVTAYPYSLCTIGNSDSSTAAQIAVQVGERDIAAQARSAVFWAGATAGDPISSNALNTNGTQSSTSSSSTGYTGGTWHSGCGVHTNATTHAAYIDGGSKGTNATSVTLTGINTTRIAFSWNGTVESGFFDGRIGPTGIWSAALTDAEVASLGKFYEPRCVHPSALVAEYRLLGSETTTIANLRNAATSLATSGGPTAATHPRVIPCE